MVLTASPAALGMQGVNHHDRTEVRSLHGFQYVQVDPPAAGPNKGKSWLRFTLTEVAAALAEQMEHSPVQRLLLMPSSGPVTLVGHETVDGRPAIYRGTVPAGDLLRGVAVPYAAGEAKDRWLPSCPDLRAGRPKDPLMRTARAGDRGWTPKP
ncbi:hypothetical protein [Streptomyces sp. NPDC021224]|uniref:hypothetical protein n=1 Tax=unclassified Streptomyces TaxID=2593676 RepID=UPI0037A10BFF